MRFNSDIYLALPFTPIPKTNAEHLNVRALLCLATLVGKFASRDPASRTTGLALRNYLKEVSFYRELRSRVSIAVPRCYYAEIEGDGPRFGLLLEDLAPAQQGDQLAGCSLEVAHAAVQQLVGLHAPSWCSNSLKKCR